MSEANLSVASRSANLPSLWSRNEAQDLMGRGVINLQEVKSHQASKSMSVHQSLET